MLEPQERRVLLEALTPPEGFVLDEGIGTTYSLDLITLIATPLAFTTTEWEDAQGEMTSNPVLLLDSLRRNIDRLTIFCQAGRIAVPSRPNPLISYLEESVVEVTSPDKEGVFHPKVWVLRFRNEESGDAHYRLLCLSRNLTDDTSWDLSLVLDGPLMERKNGFAVNRPLADFVKALPNLAPRGVSDEVRQRAERIAEEVRRVDFAIPEPFEEFGFCLLGIEGYRKDPLPDEWWQGMIVSPFIDSAKARELAVDTEGSVLVSRQEELDKLPKGALDDWEHVYVLASGAEGEPEPGATAEAADTDRPQGLHAKLFVCQVGRQSHLFVGSANATTAAFKRNVEFMVELVGTKGIAGVEQLLLPSEGQASLLSMLQTYEPPDTPVDDTVERTLDDLLNAVRNAMARAGWELHAGAEATGEWRLRLVRSTTDPLPIGEDVKVRIWPVTFPADTSAQPVVADSIDIPFAASGVGGLTSFLACEVTAAHGGKSRSIRFALNLPLIGGPAGRREAILRQILDDPQKVLRFLQFLLNDESIDPMAYQGASAESTGAGASSAGAGFVLLESLLKALAHDPTRLDEVNSLLKDLGDGDEGRSRIPAGLLEIWPAIWAARESLRV